MPSCAAGSAPCWLARRGRPGSRRLRVGPLEIDPLSRSVQIDGTPVKLSKKEFALLRALAEEPSRVFTREELLRGVWGYRSMGATRTLDSHASRLRRKLAAAGGGFIVNVWGVGYRLIDGASIVSVAAACAGWLAAAVGATRWLLAQRTLHARMEAVARACHELRGPLAAVAARGRARLPRGVVSGAQLSAIESELGRATVALEDLEGGGRPSPASDGAEFDLSALLRDSVGAWRATAEAPARSSSCNGAAAPAFVGERAALAQAVGNLIANAIEHGGTRIAVTGSCEPGEARIEVADDGAGLPAPVAELMARAHARPRLAGRGLAIASGVAAPHGGALAAAPSGRGAAGARLPTRARRARGGTRRRRAPAPRRAPAAPPAARTPSGRNRRRTASALAGLCMHLVVHRWTDVVGRPHSPPDTSARRAISAARGAFLGLCGGAVRNGLHCGRSWDTVGRPSGTRVAGLLPPSHPGLEFFERHEIP